MEASSLHQLIYQHSPSEEWHLAHPGELSLRYRSIPTVEIDGKEVYLFDWENTLQEKTVGIIKETRFTTIPPHTNHDMEFSYIYDGACDFVVNEKPFTLRKGDVLICNTDVVRSAPSYKDEHDVVISIAFRKEFFNSVFLSRLPGASPLTNMLFDLVSRNKKSDRYLVLPGDYIPQAKPLIEVLLSEYSARKLYSDDLIEELVGCLFLVFIQGFYSCSLSLDRETISDERIIHVLRYIEQDYKRCTLESASRLVGYSQGYLSNLIKEKTGRTFSEIKLNQQLIEAVYLLSNTTYSIAHIAEKVGFSNMTFFYKKFEESFGVTPGAYRKEQIRQKKFTQG